MSRVRRLNIRGIRNFEDDQDKVSIRFFRPLTLILGPNGTGKTTIIESLRFAATGEFPPNSTKGKAFITDPSLSHTSMVRGVVKAEVVTSKGDVYTICRTIECSKYGTTVKFKTLDSTLTKADGRTKKAASITNKCFSVDTELPLLLGVSKAILNNVIFCHQEDANWPFEDGKKLKEKFDQIFDSAMFNKALETIVANVKQIQNQLSLMGKEAETLRVILGEVQEKEKKLGESKARLQDSRKNVEKLQTDLEVVRSEKLKVQKKDADYKDLMAREKSKKTEYEFARDQLARLSKDIREIFVESTEELNRQIESFDDALATTSDEIVELDTRLKQVVEREANVSSVLAEERVRVGTLRQQVEDQERKVASRNEKLNEALAAWNLDTVDSGVSSKEALDLAKKLREKLRELERNAEESRLKMEKEENEYQREVDMSRTEHSKIESEKNLKENEVQRTRMEIYNLRADIAKVGKAVEKLSTIDAKIRGAIDKVARLESEFDPETARAEIRKKIEARDATEERLNAIDDEIASLLKDNSLKAELDLHRSTLLSKEKDMETLRSEHGNSLKSLLGIKEEPLPLRRLKDDFDRIQQELIDQTKSISQEIQAEQRRATTMETTLSRDELDLRKKRKELEAAKEKISSICHYKDFDEQLLLQSSRVKDLQDKKGMYAHQEAAYKEYAKQLRATDPCCPLCRRGFSNERDTVENLLRKMETEMKNHPSQLKHCEAQLKIQQEKYDAMLQLRPIVEKVLHLEDTELDRSSDNLEKSREKLMLSRVSITELETRRADPEDKLARCKQLLGQVMLWDRCIDEISAMRKTIDEFEDRGATDAGIETKRRSLEEVQAEREDAKAALRNIRGDIEDSQLKINTQNEKLQDARAAQNALHEEQLKIRTDMQTLKQMKDQQETLLSREVSLGKSISALEKELIEAENELKLGIKRLARKKAENREKLENSRKLTAESSGRLSELKKSQDEVDEFMSRKIPETLRGSESKIEKYEKTLDELAREKRDVESAARKLRENVARHQVRKRELMDNILLRKTKESMKRSQEEYVVLKEKLRATDHDQSRRDLQSLHDSDLSLSRQINVAKGGEEELQRAVEQYTEELEREAYREARKNYRRKMIESRVREEAIANLRTYSKVLDTAMIKYHGERMATVNRVMKQLWMQVYKGRDTTSIQIRTDATENVGSARRTYNYKLVQTKHGQEIDMKGRCSAGQKVLASIIIRLALTETFSKDCGILALDEPTTNLDEENTQSLASAMASIVKIRAQHQKNFQLIVITHDEKFLLKLADLNGNKGFYELYRENNGYSAIKHCYLRDWDDTMGEEDAESAEEEATTTTPDPFDPSSKTTTRGGSLEDGRGPPKRRYVFNV